MRYRMLDMRYRSVNIGYRIHRISYRKCAYDMMYDIVCLYYDIVCQPTISYVDIRYRRVPRIKMDRSRLETRLPSAGVPRPSEPGAAGWSRMLEAGRERAAPRGRGGRLAGTGGGRFRVTGGLRSGSRVWLGLPLGVH